jgi:hypothetical protein
MLIYIVLWFQMEFMMCGVVIGSCKLVLINSIMDINGVMRLVVLQTGDDVVNGFK